MLSTHFTFTVVVSVALVVVVIAGLTRNLKK
jgi:hypothetical protein